MKVTQTARAESNAEAAVLYMAAELGAKEWKLAFGGPTGDRVVTVPAWEQERVVREIAKAKTKAGLPETARVLAVQEAGRDGFAVHRFFASLGVESLVVDPASIEVPRRRRRAKTDRLDAEKLLVLLRRWDHGETTALRVVHAPTPAEEDARQLHRERDRLIAARTEHTNRLRSLLATMGISPRGMAASLARVLDRLQDWEGKPLPPRLQAALRRECARLALLEEQLAAVNAELAALAKAPARTPQARKAERLRQLKSVGTVTAHVVAHEFLWRQFRNRREVGAAAGLVGTPYNSGKSEREQGISKAGNGRIRRVMVEAAWLWLRWQPDSALSRWFAERFGRAGGRSRRVGIVALARKLLILFWRMAEYGEVPSDVVLRAV